MLENFIYDNIWSCPLLSVQTRKTHPTTLHFEIQSLRKFQVKFLVGTLDENLNLNDYVNKATTKISKSVGSRGVSILPVSCRRNAYVRCAILWCIPIWRMLNRHGEDRDVLILLACRRASRLLTDYNQMFTFHWIWLHFCLVKGFQHKYP